MAKADRPSYGWQAIVGEMHYVYLLSSESNPKQRYIGSTADLKRRLKEHNDRQSPHTSKFAPWILTTYIAFPQQETRSPSNVI